MNLTDWLKLNPEARRRAAWPFSSLNPMTSANEILRKQGLSPVRNRSLRDAIATRLTFIQFVSEDRAKSKEDDLRQDTIRQWDRVRSALGLDILHDEKDILETIKELKDKANNSIQLNLVPNEDALINCIFCRRETKCEFGFTVRRDGERALMGIHESCVEPYRKKNNSSLWTTPASEWIYEERDFTSPEVTPEIVAAAMAAPDEPPLGRVSTEDRLMVLHAATESLVEWFRKGARTIEPLLRWKQAVRDFMP